MNTTLEELAKNYGDGTCCQTALLDAAKDAMATRTSVELLAQNHGVGTCCHTALLEAAQAL